MKESQTSFYHKSLGGYNGAKSRRYKELVDQHIYSGNIEVLNMLNTKYVLTENGKKMALNPDANGNAWFVNDLKWVKNADEEIASLKEFDSEKEAFIDERFKAKISTSNFTTDSTSTITMASYSPDAISYEYNNNFDGFIVFSEIYYPTKWNVYLDGKKMDNDMVRVNYVLRGVEVPAGNHKLEVRFESPKEAIGNIISMIGSILCGALILFVIYREVRVAKNVSID